MWFTVTSINGYIIVSIPAVGMASRSTSTAHCADPPSIIAESRKDINVSLYESILCHLALEP